MTRLFHVTSALNRESILAHGLDEPAPAPRGPRKNKQRKNKQRKKKPRAGQ